MKTEDKIEGRTSMRLQHLIFNHRLQQLSRNDWLYMYVLIIVKIGKQEFSHKYNMLSTKHGSKNCVQAY
jgi:hypothetical protein